jgi:hypothetical protein
MLNELNKNHMGGFENYGADDAYNLEDTWDERRDVKPKVSWKFLWLLLKINFVLFFSDQLHKEMFQIFMTVGVLSTFSATRLMNFIITIHTILTTTPINQSSIQHNTIILIAAARQIDLCKMQVGMMVGMMHPTVLKVIKVVLGNFTEIMISTFKARI